jgi:hypothetical protein
LRWLDSEEILEKINQEFIKPNQSNRTKDIKGVECIIKVTIPKYGLPKEKTSDINEIVNKNFYDQRKVVKWELYSKASQKFPRVIEYEK